MPLSEDEQRILRQIEEDLRSDPSFDARPDSASPMRIAWLGAALLLGVVVTVAALTVHPFVAFAAFVLLVIVALKMESEARTLVRDRLSDVEVQAWLVGLQGRRPGMSDDHRDRPGTSRPRYGHPGSGQTGRGPSGTDRPGHDNPGDDSPFAS